VSPTKTKALPPPPVLVQTMTDDHLHCRDWGHAWKAYTAKAVVGGFESILVCDRCETFRVRYLTRTGAVKRTNYRYPPGYLVKGLGALTAQQRDTMRLLSLTRLMEELTT
jgi:hypothetical protein